MNRNTKRPEDAFFVLDYLSSEYAQRAEYLMRAIYSVLDGITLQVGCLPMYEQIMTKDKTIYWPATEQDNSKNGWNFSDENFEQLCLLREQITNVYFRDALTQELFEISSDYVDACFAHKDVDQAISEGYHRLMQRLGE